MIKSTVEEIYWMYCPFILATDTQLPSWWPVEHTPCLVTKLHFFDTFIFCQDEILALILWCLAALMLLAPYHGLYFFRCFRNSSALVCVDRISREKIAKIGFVFLCVREFDSLSCLSSNFEVFLTSFIWFVIIQVPKLDLLRTRAVWGKQWLPIVWPIDASQGFSVFTLENILRLWNPQIVYLYSVLSISCQSVIVERIEFHSYYWIILLLFDQVSYRPTTVSCITYHQTIFCCYNHLSSWVGYPFQW